LADVNGRISNASPLVASRSLTRVSSSVVAAVCWPVVASSIGSRTMLFFCSLARIAGPVCACVAIASAACSAA